MRILQLIQKKQLRGAEIFACQLSNHLLDLGHDVRVISLLDGNAILPFQKEISCLNLTLTNRFFDIRAWRKLAEIIREVCPDIVQANAGDTLKIAILSKMLFRWKTPVVFRNANKVSDFISSGFKLLFNKFLVHQLDHVISVSEICREDFVRTYRFPIAKTSMVPVGIEMGDPPPGSVENLKDYFTRWPVLVNVASLVSEKNHQVLLKMVRKLSSQNRNVTLLIVGDGKLRSEIQQKIEELNLQNHVFLLGYRNDVLHILRNATVFLLPSLIEGLPAVILESFFCRVPVVAYDVGGISEVVKNNETGWLLKKNDEEKFFDAIEDVLRNVEKKNLILDNAFQVVMNEFDNRKIAIRFESVYKTVVERD